MTNVQRKRRHFRDDLKKQILTDIESGKLSINNVTDPISGKPIKALLIERWKDQFRTEGMGANYQGQQTMRKVSTPIVTPKLDTDDLLREIGRLTVENNQLKRIYPQQKSQSSKSDLSYAASSKHA